MADELLYCIRLRDPSGHPELGFEMLSALELDFNSYEDKEGGGDHFVIYADSAELRQKMLAMVERARSGFWRESGWTPEAPECFTIRKEEWSEVWKKYFHILHVADNLVIRPTWLEYAAQPGQAVVDIDPGMSFGTGQHATTEFCLRMIAQHAGQPGMKRLLDAGCGSGILAIAAAKLGFPEITAFDFDPDAVRVAAENIAVNRLAPGAIDLLEADASRYEAARPFDFAAVNILSSVLKPNARRILSWLRPGGRLALAGILNREFDEVSDVFTQAGARELSRWTLREWTGGLFSRDALPARQSSMEA